MSRAVQRSVEAYEMNVFIVHPVTGELRDNRHRPLCHVCAPGKLRHRRRTAKRFDSKCRLGVFLNVTQQTEIWYGKKKKIFYLGRFLTDSHDPHDLHSSESKLYKCKERCFHLCYLLQTWPSFMEGKMILHNDRLSDLSTKQTWLTSGADLVI